MRHRTAVVAVLLAFGSPGLAWAQVMTENAGTVSPENPIWQTRFEYLKAEHLTDLRAVESFFWAPNEAMDFALSVPVHHRDVEFSGIEDTLEGVGDSSLRWKHSIWKEDDVMASTRFSALAGVKLPTGRWHEDDSGVEISRKLQLGTGGWDVYGGPLFTHIQDRHRFAAELIGRYAFERDDFRLQPSEGLAEHQRRPEREADRCHCKHSHHSCPPHSSSQSDIDALPTLTFVSHARRPDATPTWAAAHGETSRNPRRWPRSPSCAPPACA